MEVSPDHPIAKHLHVLGTDAPPANRLAATLRAYTEATGIALDEPPTQGQREAVRLWLLEADFALPKNELGHSASLTYAKKGYLQPYIHPDAAQKAGWLAQAPCLTCLPDESRRPRGINFGIRTRPFSAQSLQAAELKELKRRINEHLKQRLVLADNDWHDSILCVRVVAVVGKSDPTKDVDNMVKGLMDALQKTVYDNDRRIGHLSVNRFRHTGDEGSYRISIRPTLDPLSDVIDQEVKVIWPGQPEITID